MVRKPENRLENPIFYVGAIISIQHIRDTPGGSTPTSSQQMEAIHQEPDSSQSDPRWAETELHCRPNISQKTSSIIEMQARISRNADQTTQQVSPTKDHRSGFKDR